MNAEERAHIEHLLEINRAHLRELEMQQAKLGILAPSGIALQIAEYQRTITDLEHQLSKGLPHHNLPPRDYEQFVGRQKELAELRRLLQPYPKSRAYVITIDGIGGIGKSALALEAAYTFRDQHASLPEAERFEAIVWVSAKRSYLTADGILERRQSFRTLDDLYVAIAQVLDYPAITRAKAEDQRAIVEDVLREQRTLLVLDNLETVDDEDLLVFLRELPDPTKAVVTTRHRIDVAHPVRLTGMPHEDALRLIDQESARKGMALSAEEQEQLWQRTGGMPLAIVWSIGLMGLGGSIESVLRRLGSGQSDIAQFCFEESVAQIRGRDAYKLLMAFGLFATDASREALGVVAGLDEDEFGRDTGLEDLLRLSLVNKDGERFSLLPLTQRFIESKSVLDINWIQGARNRWQVYFYELGMRFGGWSQDWRGQDRVEQDLANILAVTDDLLSSIVYQQTNDERRIVNQELMQQFDIIEFLRILARTCRLRGYWNEAETLYRSLIQISREMNNTSRIGWHYFNLSRIGYSRGDFERAKIDVLEAREAAYRANDGMAVCNANRLLGRLVYQSGDREEAKNYIKAAIEDAERLGEEGRFLIGSKAELAQWEGNIDSAISCYQQVIAISKEKNDLPNLAFDLWSLGNIYIAAGDLRQAITIFSESLEAAQECGRVDVMARSLHSIAIASCSLGQTLPAQSNARQAADLFRRLGMKREQAAAEALLAQITQSSDTAMQ